jgi:hypothetical protein
MTKEFECDLDPAMGWPRIRFNFANGWSASVVVRTRTDVDPFGAMQASLACCPTGRWGENMTQIGETEATADEVAAYLAAVAGREVFFVPKCRKCGAQYGYDRVLPHNDGCEYARPAGVLAIDCDWPK